MTVVDLSWNNIVQLRIAFEYYLKDDTEWYIPYGRMILALSVKNHPFFRSPHLYLSSHRIHFQGARSRGVQEIMIISVRKYFLSENLSTSCLSILRWRSHTFSLYEGRTSLRYFMKNGTIRAGWRQYIESPTIQIKLEYWRDWVKFCFEDTYKSPTTSSAVQAERRQL